MLFDQVIKYSSRNTSCVTEGFPSYISHIVKYQHHCNVPLMFWVCPWIIKPNFIQVHITCKWARLHIVCLHDVTIHSDMLMPCRKHIASSHLTTVTLAFSVTCPPHTREWIALVSSTFAYIVWISAMEFYRSNLCGKTDSKIRIKISWAYA